MHRILTKASIAVSSAAVLAAAMAPAAAAGNGAGFAGPAEDITDAAGPLIFTMSADRSDCPVNHACLWAHINFNRGRPGTMVAWPAGSYTADFRTLPCSDCNGGDFHDDASSWANFTRQTYCVSWGTSGGNPDNSMPSGTSGDFSFGWNDQASSIGFIGCP